MCRCDFDLPAREYELGRFRDEAQAPDLWDDPKRAQGVMRSVSRIENLLATWQRLESSSEDISAMLELAAEGDEEERATLLAEASEDLDALERDYTALELTLTLGGEYDAKNAILSIHSASSGALSRAWAASSRMRLLVTPSVNG